jgi:formylglycine-generating enzyme required for sulfatase activity
MDQGDAFLQNGQYTQAVTAYTSVLEWAPDKEKVRKQITEAKNRSLYDKEIQSGDSLVRAQQFEAAKNAFRRAESLTETTKSVPRMKVEEADKLAEKKRLDDDRKHQEMLARQAREEFEGYMNDIKKNMVQISGGAFTFGCQPGKDEGCLELDAKPVGVEVADFYLGKYEVTNREFARFLDSIAADISLDDKGDAVRYRGEKIYSLFCGEAQGGCPGFVDGIVYDGGRQPGGHFRVTSGMENKPVLMITYQGAQAFCRWLSESSGYQYRLPTEIEWEYAARGGNQMQSSADVSLGSAGWYKENSKGSVKEIGQKTANALGLHDTRGNAMEYCSATGAKAVCKGGSYRAAPEQCSPGRRFNFSPANATGFRLAMTPKY